MFFGSSDNNCGSRSIDLLEFLSVNWPDIPGSDAWEQLAKSVCAHLPHVAHCLNPGDFSCLDSLRLIFSQVARGFFLLGLLIRRRLYSFHPRYCLFPSQ